MPHQSMEYAIMVPILLMQVILIPVTASWMMDAWVVRRRETALQDVASHIGTTIQQLYFSLNREEIAAGTTTQAANVPPFIESIPYVITASNRRVENSTIIDLYLTMMGIGTTATTRVTLGPNVLWGQSTFVSNSTSASIKVEKFSNGTLNFSFG
ncbi:MAG: hypothetical protein OEY24_01890 [Candidatus Bathyarchaeota archaeon]|nr:hypothetical protein [Candidatus Bathyarchaeota archaeon]MDH5494441.1 hypothetical protein [Candidatus Bathyarchaeota archaeon]